MHAPFRVLTVLSLFFSLGVAVSIILIIVRMKKHAKNINAYFRNAVRTYAFSGEEDAKIAALAAAKAAAGTQRASMLEYLKGMANDLRGHVENDLKSNFVITRMSQLADEITAKDWGLWDSVQEKRNLEKLNPKYFKALNSADFGVFEKTHPDLFS